MRTSTFASKGNSVAAPGGFALHGFLLRSCTSQDGGLSGLELVVAPGKNGSVSARAVEGFTWVLLAPHAERQLARFLKSRPADTQDSDDLAAGLNGVFGLVRIDKAAQEVSAWNDPLGVQPIYYQKTASGETLISNHLAWLMLASGHTGQIDPEGWLEHMSFGYCASGGRTVYENIRQLEPGSILSAGPGGLQVRRYWHPPYWKGDGASEAPDPVYAARTALLSLEVAGPEADDPNCIFGLTAGKDSLALISVLGGRSLQTGTFGSPASADFRQAELIARKCGYAHSTYPLVAPEELEEWAKHVAWQSGGLATCSYADMASFVAHAVTDGGCFVIGEGGECIRDYLGEGSGEGLQRLIGEFTTPREYLECTLNGVDQSWMEDYPSVLIADSLMRLNSVGAGQYPGLAFYREVRMPGNFRLRHAVLSALCAKISPFLGRQFLNSCYSLPPRQFSRSGLHRGIIEMSRPDLLHFFDAPLKSSTTVQDWPARMSGTTGEVFRASLLRHLEWSHDAVNERGLRQLVEASAAKPGREIFHLLRLWSFLLFRRMLDQARTTSFRDLCEGEAVA